MVRYVSEIFKERPERYGFRGDPLFWDYLEEYFSSKEFPYSIEQITDDIQQLFFQVSGEYLTIEATPYVKKFAYGGMSSGLLCGEFWINEGIPLLIKRYEYLFGI